MRLKNKIAIVTGAANGIGLSITEAFINEGATVFMADIDAEKLKAEGERFNSVSLCTHAVVCDVGNTDDVGNLINEVIMQYNRIDIIVNNAAVAIGGNIKDMPENDWDKLMNTNLKSVYRTIKLAMPHMLKQKRGSIINMSSTQAFRSWDNWTAYAAAKGAMLAMTNQLAGQFGKDNIRFNSISPGAILTPMNEKRVEKEGPGFLKSSIGQHAIERMGTPEEVAVTAVFLASDESAFITGVDIKVDGGLCTLPRYIE